MTLHQTILTLLEQAKEGSAERKTALKTLSKHVSSKDARPALVAAGEKAVLPMAALVVSGKGKARKGAAEVLAEVADQAEGAEIEEAVVLLLESLDKEPLQKLGLQIVSKVRRPTDEMLEPCADLSSVAGAKKAILRFPFEKVKRELRSLINSRSAPERIVGLELVQHYGHSAGEYTELIAEQMATDTGADTVRIAVHTLARLLPDDKLAEVLTPALDHWDADVQKAARRYLAQVDAPARGSVWDGHPFSLGLRQQLQRFGFRPKAFDIPENRPLPNQSFEGGEHKPEDADAQISRTMWAWLHCLERPAYQLYTVWGSYENTDTFHFSDEPAIYPVEEQGQRYLMHVIGDGSIGYFAALDLLDNSDDPAVYYIERWGGSTTWRASWTLSRYMRQLGTRA